MTDTRNRTDFPFAPLAAAMGQPEWVVAARLGWSGTQQRVRRAEGMSERVADRAAVALGHTGWDIWSDWAEKTGEAHTERQERTRARWRRAAARKYGSTLKVQGTTFTVDPSP